MLKRLLFYGLLLLSLKSLAQAEYVPTSAVSFSFNYFPLFYVKPFTSDLNSVYFGYHLGYMHQMKKSNIHAGINMNTWKWGSTQLSFTTIGVEVGLEKRLIKEIRKWELDLGVNLYLGELWYNDIQPFTKRDEQWYMLGANLLLGRRITSLWMITCEWSPSAGYAGQAKDGRLNLYEDYKIYWWKFFGIGVRNYF